MHDLAPAANETTARSAASRIGWTDRAAGWLLESGIQCSSGGVARFYRSDVREFRAISTEITGYTAAALVWLYRVSGDSRSLEAAIRAGRYLTREAWNPALQTMPFECRGQGELAYFFDLGIIARSLLALWRATGDGEFLDIAAGCVHSMQTDFQGPSGFHPVLSLPEKRPVRGDGGWSRQPGCYQLKAAMAWAEASEAGCGNGLRRLYDQALAGFLVDHGSFPKAEPERVMDRLHAYCYFLEGLLPRAGDAACAQALRDGMQRVARLLRAAGPDFERSDVYAQLLRVRLFASRLGVTELDTRQAEVEAAALRAFQASDSDPRIDGGFWFGRKASQPMPFVNPVSTSFCVQALGMWEEHLRGEFRPEIRDLI